jgi:ATPase subunit of ABC transporter with duplicated ATPase domains
MDYLARAKAELAQKQAQAAEVKKEIDELQAVVRRLEQYAKEGQHQAPDLVVTALQAANSVVQQIVAEQSKKARILNGACELLATRGGRWQTRVLVEALKQKGIEVGGADEVAMLSSYLSREKDKFEFVRPDGWALKKQNPTGAQTPVGPH